ncbi:hypothetical protein ACS0TY_024810 [Phlomoides rotata]
MDRTNVGEGELADQLNTDQLSMRPGKGQPLGELADQLTTDQLSMRPKPCDQVGAAARGQPLGELADQPTTDQLSMRPEPCDQAESSPKSFRAEAFLPVAYVEIIKPGQPPTSLKRRCSRINLHPFHFQQLISAIDFCHSRGVYHRDLKPENLLLDEERNLKVMNFGLSAFSEHLREDGMLHTTCGTPVYVAPEVIGKK